MSMSTKKSVKSTKYIDLISKTKEQKDLESLQYDAEMTANSLDQGISRMESKLIDAKKDVRTAEMAVKTASKNLEDAKSDRNFDRYVNNLLDKRTVLLQSEENLKAKQADLKDLQDAYDYLVDLKSELF